MSFTTRLRSLVAVTALATVLAGCGTSVMSPAGVRQAGQASALAKAKASFKYSLGADLKGATKVDADEAKPTQGILPTKVDMRSQFQPIYNQGSFGSCTAFAIAKGLGEFILKKQNRHQELSALYLWYQERKALGTVNENNGAPISLGMKIIDNVGTPPEASHPYPAPSIWGDEAAMNKFLVLKPGNDDVAAGKQLRMIDGIQPIKSLHGIKAAVAKGNPVVFGFAVFESIAKAADGGNLPVPNVETEKMMGGHAVVCVGYDNAKQVLIVRNSWGAEWGDKGYFYMPYDFTRKGLVADAWTAKY